MLKSILVGHPKLALSGGLAGYQLKGAGRTCALFNNG